MILASLAHAASSTSVTPETDLCDAVAEGLAADPDHTFSIDGDHDTDCDLLEIGEGAVVTLRSASYTVALPALALSGGADVTVVDVRFPRAASSSLLDEMIELPSEVDTGAVIVSGATVRVEGASFEDTSGAGVVVYGGAFHSTDAYFSDFDAVRPLYVIADGTDALVEAAGLDVTGCDAGGVYLLAAAGHELEATISNSSFTWNRGAGADLVAYDARGVTLDTVDIAGSTGSTSEEGALDGSPLVFRGSAATLANVTMADVQGDDGALLTTDDRAPWDRWGGLVVSGGEFAPEDSSGDAIWARAAGEPITFEGATFREDATHPFGSLYLSAAEITITDNAFLGGGAPHGTSIGMILQVLDATLAEVERNLFCGWATSGNPLWVVYGNNSTLHLSENVFQDLAATGVYANGEMVTYAWDNTFVGVDVALEMNRGDLAWKNNLVAHGQTGVVFLDSTNLVDGHDNLYWDVPEPARDAPWGFDGDALVADPLFAAAWPGQGCDWVPQITQTSPANGGGMDGLDACDESPTDIGAYDVCGAPPGDDTAVVPPDSGDPPGDDTAPPVVDTGDSAVADSGSPPTPGPDPSLTGLRGGCGCDGGGSAAALLLLPLAFGRRRCS
ncbi:MAG: hypothetical protein ACOZNI_04880 [Myxococcota bacterium]